MDSYQRWLLTVLTATAVVGGGLGVREEFFTEPARPERKVVFVQGIDSFADCEPKSKAGFKELWEVVSSALDLDDEQAPYIFSYAGKYCNEVESAVDYKRSADYQRRDTCSSIDGDGGHSARFGDWFERIRKANKDAEFDIIAHSMGGVVVLYWLSEYGWGSEQQSQVRSITTLDSPLQGRSLEFWEKAIAQFATSCRGGDAINDLKPGSTTIEALNKPLGSSSYPDECGVPGQGTDVSELARILTVRNDVDMIVPKSAACIPGAQDFPAHCREQTFKLWERLINHSCVFTSMDVQERIVEELTEE